MPRMIRWLIRRDMPQVLEIEAASFDQPWTEEDFMSALRERNVIGMVAEHGRDIFGFMVYELHRSDLHVLDLAVRPDSRRQGVGRQMVDRLKGKLSQQRRHRIVATVRESNLAAQFFWKEMGFRCVKVEREHYEDTGEDGYEFVYDIRADDNLCAKVMEHAEESQ